MSDWFRYKTARGWQQYRTHPDDESKLQLRLTKGYIGVIDRIDLDLIRGLKLYANVKQSLVYIRLWKDGKNVDLHRYLTKAQPSDEVDHLDGDGLNNSRQNLHVGSSKDNNNNRRMSIRNTSNYNGVTDDKRSKGWRVRWYENDALKSKYFTYNDSNKADKLLEAAEFRRSMDEKNGCRNGERPKRRTVTSTTTVTTVTDETFD